MNLPPIIRYGLSRILNKQFLIFLFFLALSGSFWVFQALEETYEEDFLVPIELRDVPSNVVITTDLPSHFNVSLRDKGRLLLGYKYTRPFKSVVVDFDEYANASGHVVILGSKLRPQIARQLASSTQLLSVKPDTLDFYYNYGLCKRVPVKVSGNVRPSNLFTISGTKFSQDSVTVYASREILDTITAAYTRPVNLRNLSDTTEVKSALAKIQGAKFVPNEVGMTFCVDRLVEKTVKVPVHQVNFPASKQLRTFPATVNVTFQVSMGLYRSINAENFVLVINYEDLLNNRTNQCHLMLKSVPEGVSHVRIVPQDVEYIIEEVPDYVLEADTESEHE